MVPIPPMVYSESSMTSTIAEENEGCRSCFFYVIGIWGIEYSLSAGSAFSRSEDRVVYNVVQLSSIVP